MKRNVAIDVGSKYIRYSSCDDRNLILTEPSCVAVNKDNGKVILSGKSAKNFHDRSPGTCRLIYPFSGEHSIDPAYSDALLKEIIKNCKMKNPDVYISYSGRTSAENEQIVVQSAQNADAEDVITIDSTYAAACGSGINGMGDNVIVNIGASTVEMEAFQNAKSIIKQSNNFAGDAIDKMIGTGIFRKYRYSITPEVAENLKISHASMTSSEDYQISAPTTKPTLGLPCLTKMTRKEISDFAEPVTDDFLDDIVSFIRALPDEPDKIVLTGGGAKLDGIAGAIESLVKIRTVVSKDPEYAIIRGIMFIIHAEENK